MISNYYTLLAMVRSIHNAHQGWRLGGPFTQRRNELIIPVGPTDGSLEASIVASCEPSANFLLVKMAVSRASRNSADIFPDVEGSLIQACRIHPNDRIVALELSTGQVLIFRFFGSRSNVYCLNDGGETTGTFLRSRDAGTPIAYPFPDSSIPSLDTICEHHRTSDPHMSIEKVLRRSYPTFGPLLVREFLFRSSVTPETTLIDLPDNSIRSLTRSLSLFLEELTDRPSPRIILRDDDPVHFSLLELHHLGEVTEDPQSSISRGILRYLSSQKRQDSFLSQKKEIAKAIEQDMEKTTAARDAVSRSVLDAAEIELLERYGKMIQMHLSSLIKGMTVLSADDPFEEPSKTRTIRLEPALSPVQNAERYFEKAKNARNRIEDSRKRKKVLEKRIALLQKLESDLSDIPGSEDLGIFLREHKDVLPVASFSGTAARTIPPPPPFRVYTVEGGFQVWVGKNSANNDLLTTRHTAKNDLWFHARGVGGSHVVLKANSGKGEVSKRAIHSAAAIAAHYSKMKNARHVPVSMCLGKFVRKPRKAPVGTVTIEREEVLFVDPALPNES